MLILTRFPGESILIGDNIRIKVLGYNDTTGIRIGIDAPKDIPIVRAELREKDESERHKKAG